MPPNSPSANSQEIEAVYEAYFMRMRLGMVITMFAAMVYMAFAAVIAIRLKKIEGGVGMLRLPPFIRITDSAFYSVA